MNVLVLVNDPPYGTERSYNALRLADALAKRDGDRGAGLPDGRRGRLRGRGPAAAERLLQPRPHAQLGVRRGAEVGLCGTCMDARALHDEQLVEGARRSSLEELTDWTLWADKVVTF